MRSTRAYNAMLDRYHFFNNIPEAIAYAKQRRWKKYRIDDITEKESEPCYVLVHTVKRV